MHDVAVSVDVMATLHNKLAELGPSGAVHIDGTSMHLCLLPSPSCPFPPFACLPPCLLPCLLLLAAVCILGMLGCLKGSCAALPVGAVQRHQGATFRLS